MSLYFQCLLFLSISLFKFRYKNVVGDIRLSSSILIPQRGSMIPHKKSADFFFYLLAHYSSALYLTDTANQHVPACPELLIYFVITSKVNLVLGVSPCFSAPLYFVVPSQHISCCAETFWFLSRVWTVEINFTGGK